MDAHVQSGHTVLCAAVRCVSDQGSLKKDMGGSLSPGARGDVRGRRGRRRGRGRARHRRRRRKGRRRGRRRASIAYAQNLPDLKVAVRVEPGVQLLELRRGDALVGLDAAAVVARDDSVEPRARITYEEEFSVRQIVGRR